MKHLGEAQTCYLFHSVSRWYGSWWVSGDRDALEYGHFQRITTLETIDILRHIVSDGDVTAQAAYDLMLGMGGEGRSLRLPPTIAHVSR